MTNLFRKTLLASAVTISLAAATSGAMAQSAMFSSFTVDESSVVGAFPTKLNADKITGNYVEVISFAGAPASGTFDVALRWNAGQFVGNNGTAPVNSQLGGFTPNQYGLYALYMGKGTYSNNGTQTTFNFTPGGSLRVFTDANSDTTFGQPANGSTAFTTGNTSDDKLIATGVPTIGRGTLDPTLTTCGSAGGQGINCGNFGTTTTLALTADGSKYFVAPNPFYQLSFQSGQLNNFSPTGTQVLNGSLDVVFGGKAVPEPGIVALFGLGLLSLAASRRRSAKSKKA